jgi:hypothetical protein
MREALNPPGVPALLKATLTRADGSNPAANAEFSATVPAGQYWLLMSVTVSLVQGATQTPQPTLIVDDGTTTIFQGFGASSAQNSAVTTQYTWAPGNTLTAGAAATIATAPLPAGLVLGPGYRVRSSTLGIGANSDYGAPGLLYVKFA